MTVSDSVKTLLPLMTPYTISDEDFDTLYPYVVDEYDRVAGAEACGVAVEAQAKTMLLAHYLTGGEDQIGVESEKIGKYAYTLIQGSGSSKWYSEFMAVITSCKDGPIQSACAASPGVEHEDVAASQCLDLDQEDLSDVCQCSQV